VQLTRVQRIVLTIEEGGSFTHLGMILRKMPPRLGAAAVRFISSCSAHISLTLRNLQRDKTEMWGMTLGSIWSMSSSSMCKVLDGFEGLHCKRRLKLLLE
jgi:hypothetical protein